MNILTMLGFVKAEDHAALDRKFKTAIKDLAARDGELDAAEKRIEGLLREAADRAKWNKDITDKLGKAEGEIASLKSELAAADNLASGYRADAQKWRDSLQRSRDRRSNKSPVKSVPALKSKRAA